MSRDGKESWINDILMELSEEYEVPALAPGQECGKICCLENEIIVKSRELGLSAGGLDFEAKLSLLSKLLSEDRIAIYEKNGVVYFEYKRCICPEPDTFSQNHALVCECVKLFTRDIIKAVFGEGAHIEALRTIMIDDDGCLIAAKVSLS